LIAGPHNPLEPGIGSSQFLPFASRRKIDFKAIQLLRREIQQFQPDIVHAFLPRSLAQVVLATIGLRKPPKIVSFYGITRVPSWRDPSNWITYLSPKVTMHACESKAVKQALTLGGVADHKCSVIYNCVDKTPTVDNRDAIRQAHQIPTDAFVVGTVATIRPIKGIDILIEALIKCHEIPNLYALIAGPVDDPKVAKLAQDPRIANRVKMLGYTPNANQLMPAMDLFVMPSRKEGLCRALLEAMGQSVCPVVSDAGGMKEIVRSGMDGVVFPSEDVDSLAAAIARLQSTPDLVNQYAQSAFARVNEMCAPAVVGDRILAMYQRLLPQTQLLYT
jgi:glycosyltransferase involved in cell wall biosynthesis